MKTLTQDNVRPFTGRHMAMIMIGFFAVVMGVNVTMAVMARKSWTGLIVPNSYVASQHFNAETEKRENALAKGYHFEVSLADGRLKIEMFNQAREALPVMSATVTLGRSVSTRSDTSVAMSCQAQDCEGTAELAPGLWRGEAVLDVVGLGTWRQPLEIFVTEQ